ncbi:hypothetical protein CXB51_028409 [Gossypium anomalum]|uniref:Uncharacterized protein n=1 Tax=Gossypium anomalum TaxID=47600 RepID=A0A8J5YCJ5_9ROSI|nr:hypothetical protein CXB51_028409 [Gossypium anomalum]
MVQLLNEGFKVLIIDNLDNSVIEAVDRVKELVGPELSKKLQFNLVSKKFSIFYSKDETFVIYDGIKGDLRNRDDLNKLFYKTKYCQLNIYYNLFLFHLGLCLQMTYNECNLTSVELDFTCNNWLRFDAIIHFADLKAVGESFGNPRYCISTDLRKYMVFSSSATVYGQPEKIPCVEDFELKVMNPYVCFEMLLDRFVFRFCVYQIELQYLHEYVGISSSIRLIANLIVKFLGVLGTNVLVLDIDISFDKKTRNFTKCNAGLNFTNVDLIAFLALHVNEKGDSVNAFYYYIVNPSTNIIIGAEVTHSFFTNVNTITMDLLTTIKVWVNNAGKASALIQHEWHSKSFFTIFGEVDTNSIDKSPRSDLLWHSSLESLKKISFW